MQGHLIEIQEHNLHPSMWWIAEKESQKFLKNDPNLPIQFSKSITLPQTMHLFCITSTKKTNGMVSSISQIKVANNLTLHYIPPITVMPLALQRSAQQSLAYISQQTLSGGCHRGNMNLYTRCKQNEDNYFRCTASMCSLLCRACPWSL